MDRRRCRVTGARTESAPCECGGSGWEALFSVIVGWCIVATLRHRVVSQRLTWVRLAVLGIAKMYMLAATPMPRDRPTQVLST